MPMEEVGPSGREGRAWRRLGAKKTGFATVVLWLKQKKREGETGRELRE